MKRLLIIVMVLLFMVGCGGQQSAKTTFTPVPTVTISPTPTPEPTPEPTPTPTPTPRPIDYFTDSTRQDEYNALLDKQDFAGIAASAQSYLDSGVVVSETDSVYRILEIANQSAEAMKGCIIVYDDFDEVSTVYYKKMLDISKKQNVVPSYNENGFNLRIGYLERNYVFFREADIKLDSGLLIKNSFEYDDVVSHYARGYLEYADISLSADSVSEIEQSLSATIRFTGSDGRTLDKTITSAQLHAIAVVYNLYENYSELKELYYTWIKDIPEDISEDLSKDDVLETSNETTSSADETKHVDASFAMTSVKELISRGADITEIIEYNEDTDPNELLGRPHGYTEKVNFTFNGRYEGTVEVFQDEADATSRATYIETISAQLPAIGYYVYQHGSFVFRLEYKVKPSDAEAFAMLLEELFAK